MRPVIERADGLPVAGSVEPALNAVRAGCASARAPVEELHAAAIERHAVAAVVEVDVEVSIRAPALGATPIGRERQPGDAVSIRAPALGATSY